jgi:hypothetical protein
MTRSGLAGMFGVTVASVNRWETVGGGPRLRVRFVAPAGECFIRRQRDGRSIPEIAAASGFGASWISDIEYGDVLDAHGLLAWWRARPVG